MKKSTQGFLVKSDLSKGWGEMWYIPLHETTSGTIAPANDVVHSMERGGRICDQANGRPSGVPMAVDLTGAAVPFETAVVSFAQREEGS